MGGLIHMINGQDIIIDLSAILEQVNNLAGIIAALIGGACALKGIGYLELLRQKKAVATFSFESQLYARLYELKIIINSNERMFTNLYSEIAREEWGDKRGASEKELKKLYDCVSETLKFIKDASDQMPAYENWGDDYTEMIQFLVDMLHFDIRDNKTGFKYIERCGMDKRTEYWKDICALLDRLLNPRRVHSPMLASQQTFP